MSPGYELLLVRGPDSNGDALFRYLGSRGHDVTVVRDAGDLDAALTTRVPDAVLVDPGSWGPEMARLLAALDAAELSAPVVLLRGVDLDDLEPFRAWADRTTCRLVGGLHPPFAPSELDQVLDRSVLRDAEFSEADVLDGLSGDELEARFLPRVTAPGGEVDGYEVRLRWEHPCAGRLDAAELLPRLSSGRAARALTRWLLERSLAALGAWLTEETGRELVLPVGAADVLDEHLPARLLTAVRGAGVEPAQLVLAVGDLRPLLDPLEAAPWLERLVAAGFRVSVGDHGGDGWGEALVARGCVHELRLDRRLVARARADGDARVVSWLAVRAASLLGVRVAAQGVDDEATYELLRALGVERMQGAHAGGPGAPMPPDPGGSVEPRLPVDGPGEREERCA